MGFKFVLVISLLAANAFSDILRIDSGYYSNQYSIQPIEIKKEADGLFIPIKTTSGKEIVRIRLNSGSHEQIQLIKPGVGDIQIWDKDSKERWVKWGIHPERIDATPYCAVYINKAAGNTLTVTCKFLTGNDADGKKRLGYKNLEITSSLVSKLDLK